MFTRPDLKSSIAIASLGFALAACTTGVDVEVIENPNIQPRAATWTCTGNFTMTVQNAGSSVFVTDSRGVEAELPADPPGQMIRYGTTGFALVFDGRRASWFVSGKAPADCTR